MDRLRNTISKGARKSGLFLLGPTLCILVREENQEQHYIMTPGLFQCLGVSGYCVSRTASPRTDGTTLLQVFILYQVGLDI